MSNVLNKSPNVLKLNRLWWAIEFITVEKAFGEICSLNKRTGKPPQMAVDIMYEMNEDGTYDTTKLLGYRPVTVAEWFKLPVRSCDMGITTARGEVRVPTVTICTNFANIPDKKIRFSPEAIRARDNDTCQATGRKLAPGEGNMGHDIAKTNGGRRSWENIALLDKEINRKQGTRTFKEMGWDIRPKAPKFTKVLITTDRAQHPDQLHFLHRN